MKKLLVLVLVLAMAQLSLAGLATLRVNAADVKSDYMPSDMITIEIVTDFSQGSQGADTGTGTISMDYVHAFVTVAPAVSVGTASATWLHAGFNDLHTTGLPVNAGGIAVQGVAGSTTTTAPDVAAGAILWSMEFHIPDLPASTWINITTDNFFAAPTDMSDMALETNGLLLHIVPEPVTVALLGLGGLFLRRRMA